VAAEDMWQRTVHDAMLQYRQLRQRIYWLANFLMRVQPPEPMELLRQNLNYLVPHRFSTNSQSQAGMQYLLKKLEIIFRRSGLVANEEHSAGNILGLDNVFLSRENALTDRIQVYFDKKQKITKF
jgi:hypothetical protein